jgi:hypothetical protein
VAEAHRGRVSARNGVDHGAVIAMGLPRSAAPATSTEPPDGLRVIDRPAEDLLHRTQVRP